MQIIIGRHIKYRQIYFTPADWGHPSFDGIVQTAFLDLGWFYHLKKNVSPATAKKKEESLKHSSC